MIIPGSTNVNLIKTMKYLSHLTIVLALFVGSVGSIQAQCETWNDNPRQEEAENAHAIYRPIVKNKQPADLVAMDNENFQIGFENWQKAYNIAPNADGQRPFHYIDGRLFYAAMKELGATDEEKAELNDKILMLYDQQAQCYPKDEVFLLGRKAFDMFYMDNYGYRRSTFDAFTAAVEKGGNATEYILLEPAGLLVAYLFDKEKVTQEEARELIESLEQIAEHNVVNNETYGQYYEAAKARMDAALKPVAGDIFDCEYFKKQLVPQYEDNPEDLDIIRYVYSKLKVQGCDSTDAIMVELKTKYETMAAELNAQMEAEFLANNPGVLARRLYDEGDYQGAIDKYNEAIAKEEDPEKQAEYYFGIASIQFRQLGQYSSARSSALKSAELKSGWGRPYMLIGDMYATSSRNCGSDGYSRGLAVLAAIDKYAYAKSIDPSVAEDANRRIGRYNSAIPPQSEVFMRGMQDKTVSVPCWIPEKVKVRYRAD